MQSPLRQLPLNIGRAAETAQVGLNAARNSLTSASEIDEVDSAVRREVSIVLWATLATFFVASLGFMNGSAPLGNDHSAHLALSSHLAKLFSSGQTDLFWDHSNLGLPLFASYQPLPNIMTGLLMAAFSGLPTITIFKFLIILLWATMPISWYLGARWLGMRKRQAVILGLLTLTIRSDWHVGLTLTSSAFSGLYTQVWGLWLFPLTIGAFNRAFIRKDLHWPWASILLSVTIMCHLFVGLLACIACACTLTITRDLGKRDLTRLSWHLLGTFLLCAFWLIPLLWHRDYLGGLPWLNDTYDGWSLGQSARALFSGQVLDGSRLPFLSLLAGLGALLAFRTPGNRRFSLATCLFALSCWLLLGGREVWGDAYAHLPMHANVNPLRYLTALQVVGILAASYALAAILQHVEQSWSSPKRLRAITGLALGLWLFTQYQYTRSTLKALPHANFSHLHQVAGQLAEDPEHRFMVSGKRGTGSHFHRDLLPMLANRGQLQSYALGYHATFSTYYAEHMKLDPDSLRLFNVNTLVTRDKSTAHPPFEFYRAMGPYSIFRVPNSEQWGYFDLVWPSHTAEGNLREMRPLIREKAASLFRSQQTIILRKGSSSPPQIRETYQVESKTPGHVLETERSATSYEALVNAEKGAWLMLKVNYFPYWSATVDGKPAVIHHVGPNFMAVTVPQGKHRVRFIYQNPPLQKAGALASLLLILGWMASVWYRQKKAKPERNSLA